MYKSAYTLIRQSLLNLGAEMAHSSESSRLVGNDSLSSSYESTSASLVLCIHGNKYGVARCCCTLDNDDDNEFDNSTADLVGDVESEHCHINDNNNNEIDYRARKKLILASILCLCFMCIEIIGGILANSLAIATDAAHLLTDFASFLISLFSLWVAARPATRRMSFGFHRAEVIGATISVLMIWVVTGILVYMAVQRLISNEFEIEAKFMIITSAIGLIFNIIMGCTLHQHGHNHGHSHSSNEGNSRVNINVSAAFIHVLGDFIQSLGVFVASIIIYLRPDWRLIDPVCTFIFSFLVLLTTVRILKDTGNVLMEGLPKDVSFGEVRDTLLAVEGIVAVHNLRIWALTTDKSALSAHLAIQPECRAQAVLKAASMRIRERFHFYEMTLQVEDFAQDMQNCEQCKNPEA